MSFSIKPLFRNLLRKIIPSNNTENSEDPSFKGADAHEKQDNYNFRQYVNDKNDIDGMIAYCLYKFQKVEAFDKNQTMTVEQKAEICRGLIEGRAYGRNKDEARERVENLSQVIIGKHVIAKTLKKDIFVAVGAGIVSAILAPPFWHGIQDLILKSHVVESLEDNSKKDQSCTPPAK